MLVEIGYPLQSQRPPKICQRNVSTDWAELDGCVKRKRRTVRHKAGKGITVEMVSMGRVSSPVGVCAVRRYHLNAAAWLRNAVKFADKRHHVGNMLDDVATNDFIEFA